MAWKWWTRLHLPIRNDSIVAAQPASASTAGLFGPFLDQTLRMAPQAPGPVFGVARSNLARRKPLDLEKEAKSLPTFAGDKQSKEEILLHNCLNFVQAVQDAVLIGTSSRRRTFSSLLRRDSLALRPLGFVIRG